MKFKPGQKVTYVAPHGETQKGIVKSIPDNIHAFVVYNCNKNWDNYEDYTAARTSLENLEHGWKENYHV